ncbi:MAG: hypothetical protein J0M29_14535 [Chitinophagales bacterium]|nr:hypothetical protein [Chitinophagales bacterium]
MKQTIFFFAILVALASGCYKTTDVPAVQEESAQDPNVIAVVQRDGESCCCSLVVSSTYFGGLTICGLQPGDGVNYCDRFCTTSCGQATGYAKTFPVGKDPLFCIYSGSPFRITNNGFLPIQIYFICNGGTPSTPTWIPAGGSVIFSNDCKGTTTLCSEAPCKG